MDGVYFYITVRGDEPEGFAYRRHRAYHEEQTLRGICVARRCRIEFYTEAERLELTLPRAAYPSSCARALEHYVPRLFSFLSLGHRFHAVAWATTTYHKRFHKSRDYSGLYDFKLITFYVGFSLVLRISFWYVGIVKAASISAHRLWIESVRTLCYAGSFIWFKSLTRDNNAL